jgi:type II secretory pathway component PulJ
MFRSGLRSESASRVLFRLTLVAALTLFMSLTLRAQDVYNQSTRDARRAEREARQRDLWELERLKNKRRKKPAEQQLAYQQIKEDFEQLQLRNYALASEAGPALDYEQIRKEAGEIRKRAERLKSNLTLPEREKDADRKEGAGEAANDVKAMINDLDALVKRFVWSPVFQRPNVVDLEESMKASRDLEDIIKLSERLHKLAEALAQNKQ